MGSSLKESHRPVPNPKMNHSTTQNTYNPHKMTPTNALLAMSADAAHGTSNKQHNYNTRTLITNVTLVVSHFFFHIHLPSSYYNIVRLIQRQLTLNCRFHLSPNSWLCVVPDKFIPRVSSVAASSLCRGMCGVKYRPFLFLGISGEKRTGF